MGVVDSVAEAVEETEDSEAVGGLEAVEDSEAEDGLGVEEAIHTSTTVLRTMEGETFATATIITSHRRRQEILVALIVVLLLL